MSSSDSGSADQAWDREQRDETTTERLDRNWAELLQELRVVQTGVQLLTGFLLTLPFQQRFSSLSHPQRAIYLSAVGFSVASTALLIAPVAIHRAVFRQHARAELVAAGHRLAIAGSSLLGLAISAVVLLIFDVVEGALAGTVAAAVTLGGLVGLWAVLPGWARRSQPGRSGVGSDQSEGAVRHG
jgi:hypothetical protein